ncbi:GNAT family N-acetyltransferase [Pedomonas mirosovicensis]|uniref:GNAT family N-acetyltransferase n=1 Tax=Pedomonas mirosovicensis TaxID=2908641 RepID=UPI00216A2B8A|nr:GNAT family N-acetyltransferase [Pedomonas mirosovicensis]MCH8684115.1 GNAT family N-acetyltransferase [Pedomonas mirosovicensis]
MTRVDIVLSTSPTDDMYDAIVGPLVDYNTRVAGPSRKELIALLLKEPKTKRPVGGLWGQFGYDWLFVELLVVPEHLRGGGYGTKLMQEAERIAMDRGAAGIWLDTFSFQARGFYEKLGFSVFGELPGHPRGGARYFMSKTLG